jgi:hypothetical protein
MADENKDIAEEDRAKAANEAALAATTFVDVRDVTCADATPKPSKNCEMIVVVKTEDGKLHDLKGSWRFIHRDGHLIIADD